MSDKPPWPHAPSHWLFSSGTYFVTASTFHRQRLFDTPEKLTLVTHRLLETAPMFGWSLHAWAVLANHYHFLAESPIASAENLCVWLREFHRGVSVLLNRVDATPGRRVWMNFRDTRITHQTSWLARLRYVNENPVKHKLVAVARTTVGAVRRGSRRMRQRRSWRASRGSRPIA
jgi:putative transposase